MFIKLYKVNKRHTTEGEQFYLTEVSVNVRKISFMSENIHMKTMLSEGKMNLDLNKSADFTDLRLNGKEEITVVGSPTAIEAKILQNPNKTLLRG
jgi:hypothetical protein